MPTVERTGLDEGYFDIGEVSPTSRVLALAEAAHVRARGDEPQRRDRGRDLEGRRQDRERPAEAGRADDRPDGGEASFLAPFDVRRLPVGPRSEARLRAAGLETIGALAALTDADLRRLLPGKVGFLLRDRARGIDPRRSRP